jgi:hypothetical protein
MLVLVNLQKNKAGGFSIFVFHLNKEVHKASLSLTVGTNTGEIDVMLLLELNTVAFQEMQYSSLRVLSANVALCGVPISSMTFELV